MKSAKTVPLGIGEDDFVHLCDHVAYFWETEKEFQAAIGFLEQGLRGKDHCVLFGYMQANKKVLSILRLRGWNDKELVARNRLTVLGAESSGEKTLASIGDTFKNAIQAGAPLIRLLGNIGWGKPKWPRERDLLAFEARVTSAARAFPCVVICMYDVQALSGRVVMRGGLETHPVTIRGNVVRVNPHYVPMADFLNRLKESERKPIKKPGKNKRSPTGTK